MKKLNFPLVFGSLILAIILFTSIFPQKLTYVNPYGIQNTKVSNEHGKIKLEGAPFPPSSEAVLGTDEFGRDVLSLIIYGTRLTMLLGILIVLARFLISIPIGISAGFGNQTMRTVINQFNAIFSVVPALIISIIILKLNFFAGLYKRESIIAFITVLTFVGWSKLSLIIMERVEDILSKPFIRGEIAIGKSKFKIALENVIPHLSAELVVLFFMELAMALSMVMELGVFGVYIGNVRIMADSGVPAMINFEPEWGSMLSTGRTYLNTAPWIVLPPTVAFFISIFGANLLGEGIRIKLQDKNSKFIVNVRRSLSFDKRLLLNKKFKTSLAAVACLVLVVTLINIPIKGKSVFKLNEGSEAVDKITYDRVIIGSQEAELTAQMLQGELKSIGFEPLNEDGYIMKYDIGDIYSSIESYIEIYDGSKKESLREGEDYSLGGYGNYEVNGEIYDFRNQDIYSVKDFNIFRDKFVLFNGELFSASAIEHFTEKLVKEFGVKGILWSIDKEYIKSTDLGGRKCNVPIIYIKDEILEKVNIEKSTIKTALKSRKFEGAGRNVLGILRGNDKKVGKEAIIIGVGYNYSSSEKEAALLRLKMALELGRKIKSQDRNRSRSIIIAFWDGTLNNEFNGERAYAEHVIYPSENSVLYLDLTKINLKEASSLYYENDKAPITRYFAWGVNRQLEGNFKNKGISISRYREVRSLDEIMDNLRQEDYMYYRGAIPTIIIGTERGEGGRWFSIGDIGEILYNTIVKNTY